LDEILVSNNRLARTSIRVLGIWEEQRSELRVLHEHINYLHSDMGALKERHSQCQADRDRVMAELVALRASGSSALEPQTTPARTRPIVEYEILDDDSIMVISPSGTSYAAAAGSKPKPNKIREDFPRLKTKKEEVKKNVPENSRLGVAKPVTNSVRKTQAAKSIDRARTAKVGPRFETTTGDEGWIDLRKSIEQKIQNPKIRTIKSKKGGMILFPENAETAAALRRTNNLVEKAPRMPRVIAKYVDRHLEKELILWALRQNTALEISEEEVARIKPLFMLGPREGHAVHWVIEVAPETLQRIEGKFAYLGMTKCKMKIYDSVTQCFNCQRFGHTARTCIEVQPRCRIARFQKL